MKTFSVLTVSKRTGWEQMANESMHRQSVSPKQWIIVSEGLYSSSFLQSYGSTLATHLYSPKPHPKLSDLNHSLNIGLRKINTDYVIFYQDFIKLQEDCFEKLLGLANDSTWVTTCTPNYDGSNDSRYTGVDVPRPCRPEEWEANVSIAPMSMVRELGGFDERLDAGWSWDNALLARKAAMLGAKFICDESNRPKLYPHEMSSHETLPKNGELCERIIRDIQSGNEPIRCPHL